MRLTEVTNRQSPVVRAMYIYVATTDLINVGKSVTLNHKTSLS